MEDPRSSTPSIFIAVNAQRSKANIGPILRCAAAFGVEEVLVVGASKISSHGAHGAGKHVKTSVFPSWDSAVGYLRRRTCELLSVCSWSWGVSAEPPVFPEELKDWLHRAEDVTSRRQRNVAVLTGYTAIDREPFAYGDRVLFVPMQRRRKRLPESDQPKWLQVAEPESPAIMNLPSDVVLAVVLHHLAEFHELQMQGIGEQDAHKFNLDRLYGREAALSKQQVLGDSLPAGGATEEKQTADDPSICEAVAAVESTDGHDLLGLGFSDY